jgi:hypothetical protein
VQQKNLADLYGLDPIPWSRAVEALEASEPQARCFLATTRPDGRPHVAVAERVTDEATLQRVAKRYAVQGWPATAEGDALTAPYSAPSAGPAPWNLYAVKPVTIFGLLTAGTGGATRWRFDG